MTRQATFKQKIRERMQKTGERYAAARLALLSKAAAAPFPKGAAIVPGYALIPGVHGDTARLVAAMAQAGVLDPATGQPFPEAKVFGLTGGIGFMYFLFEYRGFPPMLTFTCRSWSMPGPLLEQAVRHAGVAHSWSETTSAKAAEKALDAALAAGRAAHITLDLASLPQSGMDRMCVGQAPAQANVIGTAGDDLVVDLGSACVLPRRLVAAARAAVRKEKHRLVTFAPGVAKTAPADAVRQAVAHTVKTFRESPFRGYQGNFGLKGLQKAAKLMADPKDKKGWPTVFASGPLAFRALYRTWECAMLALTPPAGGRPFYAQFLDDAARLPGRSGLREAAALARTSGESFEAMAEDALAAGGAVLASAVELTERLDELRRAGGDAGDEMQALRRERDALGDRLTLDASARQEVFARLGAHMARIAEVEGRLVEALERAVG